MKWSLIGIGFFLFAFGVAVGGWIQSTLSDAPVFLKRDLCELLYGSGALVDDIFWDGPKAKLRQEFPA